MSQNQLSPEVNAKVKTNLIWIYIFTVIMIFAGFTSGYIVMQGSNFWVYIPMPKGFLYSTIFIFISSACLLMAHYAAKNGKAGIMKGSLGIALLTGIFFGYHQLSGFKQLFQSGNAASGQIIESSGRYGYLFTVSYEGKSLSYDNSQFYWMGEPISENLKDELKIFGAALEVGGKSGKNEFDLQNYGSGFMLFYEEVPVTYANNQLYLEEAPFDRKQLRQTYEFGENLANDRGDFIMRGEYGKDFWIYYNGKQLQYENRTFYIEGKEISAKLQNDLFGANNTSSSFIYAMTGIHLLHWLGGIIALFVVFIRGLASKYSTTDTLGIKLASMYWHFLGILWLYLYLFLIFIH